LIFIDTNNKQPEKKWLNKSRLLTQKLINATDEDSRKKIIKDNRNHWSDLKTWLQRLSHNKCWYSEARDKCSDFHVDHFRPKSCAKQCNGEKRNGYWWLAFDWKNYRISGSICNCCHRGDDGKTHGKSDFFPLRDDSPPARDNTDDIRKEISYLLDPTNPDDPVLLTFDETGTAIPSEISGWNRERAEVTIELLHLNYYLLTDERKRIWQRCRSIINRASNKINQCIENRNTISEKEVSDIVNELRELIKPDAELSATAKACLISSGYDWAMRLAIDAN